MTNLRRKNRAPLEEDRARNCQDIVELRRTCCTEAERAPQLRSDERSTQKVESKSTVNQLVVQIQELQDKVNSWNDTKEIWILKLRGALDYHHVPSQPMSITSPRGMISRDSCLQLVTRTSDGTSGHVFEGLLARGEPSSALFENSKNLASSSCRLRLIDTGKIAEKRGIEKRTAEFVQYRLLDFQGSYRPGILHIVQEELILEIVFSKSDLGTAFR